MVSISSRQNKPMIVQNETPYQVNDYSPNLLRKSEELKSIDGERNSPFETKS